MVKPFVDERNTFRWFIERNEIDSQTAEPTGETVTSWYRYRSDFERGLERYVSGIISYGELDE
jgi:hypothetical protein